mgnify:CR=1 FL=1
MESPVAVVKQAIQPGTIIKGIVGALIVFAIFDLLNFTDYILRPVTALKARFAAPAA